MVAGRVDGDLVGFAIGHPLPSGSQWWAQLRGPHRLDTDFLREDGHRTFALNELMVHPAWRGRGFGRDLHDALLVRRTEQRATLLVRQDNEPARSAYLRWGWEVIGKIRPSPDLPFFDALIRQPAAGAAPGTPGR
jgi:ribosomal protein S18 acetylase RimI-like enzyme